MQDLFLLESGFLGRNQNTLIFENISVKRRFPVKAIDSIFLLGEISLNSKLLSYLAYMQIPVYFYNYSGNYVGVYYPFNKKDISGKVLVKQVEHYLDLPKRLFIAKRITDASLHNLRKTLMQYGLKDGAKRISVFRKIMKQASSVNQILSSEANAKKMYYREFNRMIQDKKYHFHKRTLRPPEDRINCLISFGNALLYNSILSEISKTKLNPLISYVHEPFDNRYSLNLDFADIFKPLIVDRIIFTLINKKMLSDTDFIITKKTCYLHKSGREKFVRQYDLKLKQSIKLIGQDKSVSYKYLLRKEAFNLMEYLMEAKKYKCFQIWW